MSFIINLNRISPNSGSTEYKLKNNIIYLTRYHNGLPYKIDIPINMVQHLDTNQKIDICIFKYIGKITSSILDDGINSFEKTFVDIITYINTIIRNKDEIILEISNENQKLKEEIKMYKRTIVLMYRKYNIYTQFIRSNETIRKL